MKEHMQKLAKEIYTRETVNRAVEESSRYGFDVRAGYFWWGPLGGSYSNQGSRENDWPTCLPPLACDRPEFAKHLVAHWAYVLAIHPALVAIRPTTTAGIDGRQPLQPDGGFMVDLTSLPLERLQVPQASGSTVGYVPI